MTRSMRVLDVDYAYVALDQPRHSQQVKWSREVGSTIVLDYNCCNDLLGVEYLSVSAGLAYGLFGPAAAEEMTPSEVKW